MRLDELRFLPTQALVHRRPREEAFAGEYRICRDQIGHTNYRVYNADGNDFALYVDLDPITMQSVLYELLKE